MNSLERSLVQKAGYDNGWDVVLQNTSDGVPELLRVAHDYV